MRGARVMTIGVVGALVLAASGAAAQPDKYRWSGFLLHPEGADDSFANAVDGESVSGNASWGIQQQHAILWTGPGEPYVSLRPPDSTGANVYGADGGRQVGHVFSTPDPGYGALWRGTAESVIDFRPPDPYLGGTPAACRDNQIVGYGVTSAGDRHAGLWLNDDPNQFVDLHPTGADWSWAHATDGQWQGGEAAFPGVGLRAALWKRTPWSFVDMGPADFRDGKIRGMAPGTQVGTYTDLTRRAVLWHDTPESWVPMTPSWSYSCALHATTGDMHVGWASRPGVHGAHAGIWTGDDPESFFDLHDFVPPEFADYGSAAYDIDTVDGVIYIAGTVNTPLANAFLWVGVPLDDDDAAGPKPVDNATRVERP